MKTDIKTLLEIKRLHEQYVKEVEHSGIKPLSIEIYKSHSKNFVRWIDGDFVPGGKLRRILEDNMLKEQKESVI
ncbi:hypothetical protein [Dyadobacter sp. CY356]|uniref:hypothetical protein n=1 Tax=Dyadobacter sp. CY356 TaxID=2906442 RepID=UPI001F3F86C5|nr:hypothetical protein [Dyadobacter sp. CY356]MCF0057228.1 hypothetical protein [Dyadobacter sp. CY356]